MEYLREIPLAFLYFIHKIQILIFKHEKREPNILHFPPKILLVSGGFYHQCAFQTLLFIHIHVIISLFQNKSYQITPNMFLEMFIKHIVLTAFRCMKKMAAVKYLLTKRT